VFVAKVKKKNVEQKKKESKVYEKIKMFKRMMYKQTTRWCNDAMEKKMFLLSVWKFKEKSFRLRVVFRWA
jgi:inorganic pyrophosphatase/exopolyphosphatase